MLVSGHFSATVTRTPAHEVRIPVSDRQIETTHTGSLPRLPGMLDLFRRLEAAEATAGEAFDNTATAAVREVGRRQVEAGITIANDGEQRKTGYADYMRNRITGFEEGYGTPRPVSPHSSEFAEDSADQAASAQRPEGRGYGMWVGTGPWLGRTSKL